MSDYLIIDSNKTFAEKLRDVLPGDLSNSKFVMDISLNKDLAILSFNIVSRLISKPNTTILINAEAVLKDSLHQQQQLVEIAFWLRCKYKLKNPIVFYSFQSLESLLKAKAENFIILSPGCYHLELPIGKKQLEKIANFKPLKNLISIKTYLKSSINLELTRHTYANYAGMNFMLNIVNQIYDSKNVNNTIDAAGNLLDTTGNKFSKLYKFRSSLTYQILSTYFNLEKGIKLDEDRKSAFIATNQSLASKKIILIDDLAEEGWELILNQVIYGDNNDSKLISIPTHKVENGKKIFDVKKLKIALEEKIKADKPHLILLDLRLDDEEGKKQLHDLGGFKLLEYISANCKGLPVIMFTATTNAEDIKILLGKGAEAVWTKPGLDEGLNANQILGRYENLLKLIENTVNKFENLNYNENNLQFSEFRIKLLEKIEWVKYRLSLYSLEELKKIQEETKFNDYTDIYIDTNYLINNRDDLDVVESLCNLYLISEITSNTEKVYKLEQNEFIYKEPKIVISNQIFDEFIKKIKQDNEPIHSLIYSVIRELFEDSIRTEYERFTNNSDFRPQYKMRVPKENLHADPFIIDDISHLIVLGYKKIKFEEDSRSERGVQKTVYFPDRKVLLVSNDRDLIKKTSWMFSTEQFANCSVADFNEEARKINL